MPVRVNGLIRTCLGIATPRTGTTTADHGVITMLLVITPIERSRASMEAEPCGESGPKPRKCPYAGV